MSAAASPPSTGSSTSPPTATTTLATGERSPDLVAGRGAGGHIARINAISSVLEIQEEIAARMPANPEAARLAIPKEPRL